MEIEDGYPNEIEVAKKNRVSRKDVRFTGNLE